MPIDPRQESDLKPHGWAGTGGSFHTRDTTEEVGAEYAAIVEAARDASLSKRETELTALHGDVGDQYPHHIRGYGG